MPSPVLLILTVGTGTAGSHSNLAAGLRRTVELIEPRAFWLVPSTDETSRLTADLIRDGLPHFTSWSDTHPYLPISRHDSLEDSRATVRRVIAAARAELRKGERLIVNPTSGTKQMSAGATIAALDEGLGELAFTIGERADGVVKTGTERIETFDASAYHAERDRERAASLFQIGAYEAAASLLAPHHPLANLAALCRCLHEWQRQNYRQALEAAKRCDDPRITALSRDLRQLAEDADGRRASPRIAGDLLARAIAARDRGDGERALFLACKAAETALDCRFQQLTGLFRPYPVGELQKLPHWTEPDRHKLLNSAAHKKVNLLTGQLLAYLRNEGSLDASSDELADSLRRLLDSRNDLVHHVRPVEHDEAHAAVGVVRELFRAFEIPVAASFPGEL